jgi:hypothetical protein
MWSFAARLGVSRAEWLYSVNPAAVGLASFFVFGLLVVATVQRWSLPPLYLYGAGLVVVALGLVVIAGSSSVVLYALGAAVTGIGQAAAYGVPVAYAAIAVRGRMATLVVGGYLAVLVVVSGASNAIGSFEGLRTPVLVTSALLDLGIGAALLVFARSLHREFFDRSGGGPRNLPARWESTGAP